MHIPVYTTAGTDEKCRWCESLGATKAINYKTQDFETELKNVGIDLVLDMTGGDYTIKTSDSCAWTAAWFISAACAAKTHRSISARSWKND
ncbi:zinc-binding dehydrogenase [Puia sp. P3]|uniref:zinc-binding dehydrogenase n=1 Tax=Puia sp. P3 TaxID=3423952 RepID=UPI003D67D45A